MPMGIGLGIGVTRGGGVGVPPGDPITAIFADGTDGFYFDFSKTDQLFQDVNGVTLANDPGENIGLALESHAWGGANWPVATDAMPENIGTNPNFTNDVSGWVADGSATIAWDSDGGGGAALVDITGIGGGITDSQVFPLTVGKRYRVRWRVRNGTFTGDLSIRVAGVGIATVTATGSYANYEATFVAGAADVVVALRRLTATTGTIYIDSVSIKEVPGNHGLQATAAAQPKWQTGGLARFDGSDDNLLTPLVAGTSNTLMVKLKFGSSAASRIAIGGTFTASERLVLGRSSAEKVAGGVGTQTLTVITGGSTITNLTGVAALVQDGSTVNLYWNNTLIYSGAQSGAVGSAPLRVGAAGATASFFSDDDIYYALAIKKALTATEIADITNLWGTS